MILTTFTTIILLLKSWIFVPIYWFFWILYFGIGRYVTCRHCDFLGKTCPSWCMGIIGGKLFERSNKKDFCENGPWNLIVDVSFLVAANLVPYIMYAYYLYTFTLTNIDWILIVIYSALGFLTFLVHSRACKKCPISACPLSGTKKSKTSIKQ